MKIERILEIPGGPPALGPYAPVVAANDFLFVSGQTPFDPAAGQICRGTIAEQTALVLANLKRVVEAGGGTIADIVQCRIYLQDLNKENFEAMNRVYGEFFGENKPARTTVGCQLLGMDVEIEAVAVRRRT